MIVMYKGRRGTGKTLTMVKDGLGFYNKGWVIYSNFEVVFPYKKLNNDDILNLPDNDNIKNCVIMIDEIQTIIDSRRSMKSSNLNFSYWIQQIRKKNIVLLCTTQFTRTTDLRLREHIDIVVKPKFLHNYPVVTAEYFDITSEEDLGYIDSKVIVYNPTSIFGLYDTNEIKKSSNMVKVNAELVKDEKKTISKVKGKIKK